MDKKVARIRSYMVIITVLLLSLAAFAASIPLYMKKPGLADAGMYPLLTSGLMLVSMIAALWQARRKYKDDGSGAEEGTAKQNALVAALREEFPPRTVFMGACIIGYGILCHFAGFYISTAIFMPVTMLGLYRGKKVKMIVCVTVAALICVYAIIEKLFNIPLP